MDPSTFATFYAEHEQRLVRYTRRHLQSHYSAPSADTEAEDICQSVWTSLWKSWATFETLPSPKYLYVAVKHRAIELWRRHQVIAWVSLDQPLDEERSDSARFADWLIDPHDALDAAETHLDVAPLIAAALRMLSGNELRAFLLYEVIGERLPPNGAPKCSAEKMNILRARHHLATAYRLAEQAQRDGVQQRWPGRGGKRKAAGSTPGQRQALIEQIARDTSAAGLSDGHPARQALLRLAEAGVDVSVTRVRGGESFIWLGPLAARRHDFAGLIPLAAWVKHWRRLCLAAGIPLNASASASASASAGVGAGANVHPQRRTA